MSSGIICLQAGTYGSLFHFISSFRIVPVRQEFSPFAWLAGILCYSQTPYNIFNFTIVLLYVRNNYKRGNYYEENLI